MVHVNLNNDTNIKYLCRIPDMSDMARLHYYDMSDIRSKNSKLSCQTCGSNAVSHI